MTKVSYKLPVDECDVDSDGLEDDDEMWYPPVAEPRPFDFPPPCKKQPARNNAENNVTEGEKPNLEKPGRKGFISMLKKFKGSNWTKDEKEVICSFYFLNVIPTKHAVRERVKELMGISSEEVIVRIYNKLVKAYSTCF